MRSLGLVLLYAALSLGANPALAERAQTGALIALAEGDMAKIRFATQPVSAPSTAFVDASGTATSLEAYRGRHVLLNFWALWCAPCRHEMPALNALDAHFDGAAFDVVTVATGRNSKVAVDKFFDELSLTALPKYYDPKMELARDFGVQGLPISVLIDPEGREIGRLIGDAVWDGPEAKRLIAAWIGSGG